MPSGPGQEQGRSGLNFSTTGYVEEEYLANLQGRQAIRVYKEMSENDPVIGAILFAIDMLMRSVDWRVEENPDGQQEDAEFLESCMDDMSHSWSDFISEVMSMVRFGFSFFEIVYKKRDGQQDPDSGVPTSKHTDGKIGWRKLAQRSQDSLDRWAFDEDGGIQAFIQKPPPTYQDIAIPMVKGLLFRTTTYKNNPEGRSALRSAYRPWFYKKRIEEIEGVGIERDLAGLPFVKVDPNILAPDASEQEKSMLNGIKNIIRNVRLDREAGVIWPNIRDDDGNEMYTFELLNSGGSRQFDTSAIIQRYDQRIAMIVLADFILLGHEKVGSFALSSDKTDLFAVALGTWLDSIQDVINRFAVPRLFQLNGMPLENMPTIVHGDIEKPDLQEVATFITALTGAGMPLFPDENMEKYVREIASFPEQSEDAKDFMEQQQQQQLAQLEGGQADQGQGDGGGTPPEGDQGQGGEPDIASLLGG